MEVRRFFEVPVCFLDIDGVLNGTSCKTEFDFIQESIDVLNWMKEKWNIAIVLSSSWRGAYTMKFMSELFREKGIKAEIVDKTPEYVGKYMDNAVNMDNLSEDEFYNLVSEDSGRNAEVLHYIRRYEISRFIILDDIPFSNSYLREHQIHTIYFSEDCGLRWKHKQEIIRILDKSDTNRSGGENIV